MILKLSICVADTNSLIMGCLKDLIVCVCCCCAVSANEAFLPPELATVFLASNEAVAASHSCIMLLLKPVYFASLYLTGLDLLVVCQVEECAVCIEVSYLGSYVCGIV